MDATKKWVSAIKAGDAAGVESMLGEHPELVQLTIESVPTTLLAYYYGHPEIGRLIAQHKGELSLYEAAVLGDVGQLKARASGSDLDVHSIDGFTALGFASYFGQAEVVHVLLDLGASPNVPSANPLGVAPLHSALSAQAYEIVELLLSHGADPNLASKEGWTPLHYTASSADISMTDRLLKAGAKPGLQKNSDGKHAADLAREQGAEDVAKLIESYY